MLTLQDLQEACAAGGASVLTSVTELEPAAGKHASVAPAKFVDSRSNNSVFAFETRFVDGRPSKAVIIDSKQSSINRGENAVSTAIQDGDANMSRIPRIVVSYENGPTLSDFDLPHRFSDGHIRAGSIDGKPATSNDQYCKVRDSTMRDASAILNIAPSALLYGGWDSTRKWNQLRLRSALVGEVVGILADQTVPGEEQQSIRGGARVDPVAASVKLDPAILDKLVDAQEDELSPSNVSKNRNEIKAAKKGDTVSASTIGLGAIPPTLNALGGVSCQRIIRSWVLSFSTLRQLRFGGSVEQDIAARCLIAALGLVTIARAEQELYLRANCDLVEAAAPVVKLDRRQGNFDELSPITVPEADALFAEALAHAESTGIIKWNGQTLNVVGNPDILGAAVEAEENED